MRVLVVGGAGYIGSHAARRLARAGHDVAVFDDLSLGHRAAVLDAPLFVGDLLDPPSLNAAIAAHQPGAVMHFAALASVPESVADPARYDRVNVVGTLNLLDAMRDAGVAKLVFSSTAAVYGVPDRSPIAEDTLTEPINPYGRTKLAVERALADHAHAYGLGYAALRYFNACGASDDGAIGEDHTPETHLIPIVLQAALGLRPHVQVFGTDYPTPDGSCVRDYVHVEDLADAHLKALERIVPGRGLTSNVATGRGFSVREVVASARRVTGRPIEIVERPRRPGDPPELIASPDRARRELDFAPRYVEIDDIIASAWRWHERHPNGYGDR